MITGPLCWTGDVIVLCGLFGLCVCASIHDYWALWFKSVLKGQHVHPDTFAASNPEVRVYLSVLQMR